MTAFITILPPQSSLSLALASALARNLLLWKIAEFCFGHNLWTVTRKFARFEALESLFNSLSNDEWISTKLMTFISLNLSLILWRVAQNRAFEAASSTLYCSRSKYASIPTKRMENYQTVHKYTKTRLNTKYTYLYTKRGIIQRISTKEPISATKHIYKITTFWHLSTLPNLKHCLSSNKVKQLKETKAINQRIMNQQVLKTENKWMVQLKIVQAK